MFSKRKILHSKANFLLKVDLTFEANIAQYCGRLHFFHILAGCSTTYIKYLLSPLLVLNLDWISVAALLKSLGVKPSVKWTKFVIVIFWQDSLTFGLWCWKKLWNKRNRQFWRERKCSDDVHSGGGLKRQIFSFVVLFFSYFLDFLDHSSEIWHLTR